MGARTEILPAAARALARGHVRRRRPPSPSADLPTNAPRYTDEERAAAAEGRGAEHPHLLRDGRLLAGEEGALYARRPLLQAYSRKSERGIDFAASNKNNDFTHRLHIDRGAGLGSLGLRRTQAFFLPLTQATKPSVGRRVPQPPVDRVRAARPRRHGPHPPVVASHFPAAPLLQQPVASRREGAVRGKLALLCWYLSFAGHLRGGIGFSPCPPCCAPAGDRNRMGRV